jgi:RNA polymerase sigma-70 factor (ECF subfamily)
MANSYALHTFASTPKPAADLTNPSHFEQFVLAYSSIVLTVCLRLLKDRYAAEDACQETFVAAWRHRTQLHPSRAWLLKVATNKCLDELRWRSRHPAAPMESDCGEDVWYVVSPEPTPEARMLRCEAQDVIQSALLQLPWVQRIAIVLSDVEGWSYIEIARTCDVSIGTVKSRIFRARKALREALSDASLLQRAS